MTQPDLLQLLDKIKTDFYSSESKNTFFKNAQKLKCAEKLATTVNLIDLLQNTVYIIPNTHNIYIDYPVFKLFATNANSEEIINYIISMLSNCIYKYGQYEMHINLKGFSISAAQRYKNSIQLFCDKCYNITSHSDMKFSKLLVKMYIYNTPSIISNITSMFSAFIDPAIPQKLRFYSKDESQQLLDNLFSK